MSSSRRVGPLRVETLVSVSLFFVLAALYLFTRPDRVSSGMQAMQLQTFEPSEVQKIRISGTQNFTLVNKGETWMIAKGDENEGLVPADSNAVAFALRELSGLRSETVVTVREDKYESYEVSEDKGLHITLEGLQGTLLEGTIGSNAKSKGFYFKKKGEKEVFITEGQARTALSKNFLNWRRKTLTTFAGEHVDSIQVVNADQTSQRFLQSEGTWSTRLSDSLAGQGYQLDAKRVREFATAITNLRAKDFIEDWDVNASGTTLLRSFELKSKDDTQSFKLYQVKGSEAAEEVSYYATNSTDALVYTIPEYSAKKLMKNTDALCDHHLVPKTKIAKIRLQGPELNFAMQLNNDVWALNDGILMPEATIFDGARAKSFARELEKLEAKKILTAPIEMGASRITLIIEDESGTSQTIQLATQELEREEGGNVMLARHEGGLSYEVPVFQARKLLSPFDEVKEVPPPRGGMPGMNGMPGMGGGMENLPPELQQQLMQALQQQGMR